jgi:hypothetical protein
VEARRRKRLRTFFSTAATALETLTSGIDTRKRSGR